MELSKKKLKKFIEKCISTGYCVKTALNLTRDQQLEIEDILYRYNDKTATTKIRKIVLTLNTIKD